MDTSWSVASHIIVSRSDNQLRLIDGSHRLSAVKALAKDKDPKIANEWQNFKIPTIIIPKLTHVQEISLAMLINFDSSIVVDATLYDNLIGIKSMYETLKSQHEINFDIDDTVIIIY